MKLLLALLALARLTGSPAPQVATIDRQGAVSVLSFHGIRPIDVIASTLEAQFGIGVGAEEPSYHYRGDLLDIATEEPRVRRGLLVPARWGIRVEFAVKADGTPRDVPALLHSIVAAANAVSPFVYRLDSEGNAYSLVPTRNRDASGQSIAAVPLLDRLITIPSGVRKRNEIAGLMAGELSRQTGLRVNCCQSFVAGYPWGMEEVFFEAKDEPARKILQRLGLQHWHVRCDQSFCFIDLR